jgi:hypothetical protein
MSKALDLAKVIDGVNVGVNADKVDGFNVSQTPSANEIPVLNSSGQMRLPFSQNPILVNGQDLMYRTFYVDAVNGDDNNDGSSGHPFKTLQKAVDSVPISGFAVINLVSDYTGEFSINFKNIRIVNNGTWTIPMGDKCDITGSSVLVFNQGQLIVDRGDGSNINPENYTGFWANDYEKLISLQSITNLYLVNYKTSNPIRIDSDRALFGSRSYGANQNIQMNLAIYNIYSSGNFILDGNLLHLRNGCGSFQWNNLSNDSSFQVVDGDSNAVDVKTKVAGIIKDANGVPRNILSNIIF